MARTPRLPVTLTHDFDRMPPIARAEILFVSSTELTWKGFLTGGPLVWRMMRRLKRTPGFVANKSIYRFPLTTGAIAFFDGYDALAEFARSPEHRALVKWGSVPGRIRSGFIRIMRTAPTGSAFGEWIADDEIASLDRRRLIPVVAGETRWAGTGVAAPRPAPHLRPVAGCPVTAVPPAAAADGRPA